MNKVNEFLGQPKYKQSLNNVVMYEENYYTFISCVLMVLNIFQASIKVLWLYIPDIPCRGSECSFSFDTTGIPEINCMMIPLR